MSRRCDSCKKHIFMLILALQLILRVTLSNDNPFWCGKVGNEATDVWIGHNVTKRFYLKDPILDNQIIVWTKGNSTWVKRNGSPLEYIGHENYSHTRYRMAKVSNVICDLFIDHAEQTDTGHHVVTVNLGEQSLCTALMMDLTVNTPEPLCSSRLNKSDGKLQMSCQWVQTKEGDRAHFEFERKVLYEHEIPEVNFNGNFNVTHKFNVNLGLDRLVDEITVPPRCVVSQKRGKGRETCEFLEVRQYPRKNTQNETAEFKCCAPKSSKPLPLIYDCHGEELSINSTQNYTSNENKCIVFFLCGVNDDHNSNITVIKMEQLDVRRLIKYGSTALSVEVGELEHDNEHDNASENQGCEVMTVKVTNFNSTLNNQDGTSTDTDNSKNHVSSHSSELDSGTIPTHNPGGIATKYRHVLIAAAATSASVLAFFTGACITKCYYMYCYSPGKHYDLVRRDTEGEPQRSPPAAEDDAGNLARTTFITQIPQQDVDVASQGLVFQEQPTDENVQYFKREAKESCLAQPKVTHRGETSHDSGGCSEGVKKNHHQQNAPTANARTRMPDSTYYSVDDVENTPSNTKERELSGKNRSCLPAIRQDTIRDDWKGSNSPNPNLDQLYAKPDMSKKTKNKASLESAYDDPPAENFFARILVQNDRPLPTLNTDQAFHVYGNAITSPTDESATGDELYINAPGQDMF